MKRTIVALTITLLSACTPYSLMAPGENKAGPISFNTTTPWNKFNMLKPGPKAEIWTADGKALNNIIIFKGIGNGEKLFKSASPQNPMPEFKSDMLPQEVLELTQTSLAKYYGESNVLLTVEGLKPAKFLNNPGFRFNIKLTNQNGLNYLGKGVATIQDQALYMMIYTGTQLYYYRQHEQEFENIVKSAKL